jgi:predicted ATPase
VLDNCEHLLDGVVVLLERLLAGSPQLAVLAKATSRQEGHLATARLIVVAALAGDWDEALTLAERFREGWERRTPTRREPQPLGLA